MKVVRAALAAVMILAAAMIFALVPESSFAAFAADTPHIVADGDVWLLSGDGVRLFMLPDTYYARINNLDEKFYYVTFNGVSGKVDKNTVSAVGYHTTAAGTSREIGVSADFSEFTAINLKVSPDVTSDSAAEVPVGASITFLGVYPAETLTWYYVKYENSYGYIRADRTTMPSPDIEPFVPEVPPSEDVSAPADNTAAPSDGSVMDALDDNELKIIIIVGLAVPAIAVVVLLFRSRGAGRSREPYDDGKRS